MLAAVPPDRSTGVVHLLAGFLTCVMLPRAAYRLTAAKYEFMAALYSAQSRSRSEQMRRIGLDRIAFGRELSEHGSRNRVLRPTYGIPELPNCSALIEDRGAAATCWRMLPVHNQDRTSAMPRLHSAVSGTVCSQSSVEARFRQLASDDHFGLLCDGAC